MYPKQFAFPQLPSTVGREYPSDALYLFNHENNVQSERRQVAEVCGKTCGVVWGRGRGDPLIRIMSVRSI